MYTITVAGYIIADNGGVIHGLGTTVNAAWQNAEAAFESARIELLDDDADSSGHCGSWTRRSGLEPLPASATLLADIEAKGGTIAWRSVSGVACTRDEAEG